MRLWGRGWPPYNSFMPAWLLSLALAVLLLLEVLPGRGTGPHPPQPHGRRRPRPEPGAHSLRGPRRLSLGWHQRRGEPLRWLPVHQLPKLRRSPSGTGARRPPERGRRPFFCHRPRRLDLPGWPLHAAACRQRTARGRGIRARPGPRRHPLLRAARWSLCASSRRPLRAPGDPRPAPESLAHGGAPGPGRHPAPGRRCRRLRGPGGSGTPALRQRRLRHPPGAGRHRPFRHQAGTLGAARRLPGNRPGRERPGPAHLRGLGRHPLPVHAHRRGAPPSGRPDHHRERPDLGPGPCHRGDS